MEKQDSLSRHLKSLGVRSVADLARHARVAPPTLFRWYRDNDDRDEILAPAVERYLKDRQRTVA